MLLTRPDGRQNCLCFCLCARKLGVAEGDAAGAADGTSGRLPLFFCQIVPIVKSMVRASTLPTVTGAHFIISASLAAIAGPSSANSQGASGTLVPAQEGLDKCVSLSGKGAVIQHDASEWWNDGCRHCYCEHGQEYCSLISCPDRPADCPADKWELSNGKQCFFS